jgi:hypothetical protein
MAIEQRRTPREVDVAALRERLRRHGAILSLDEVAA